MESCSRARLFEHQEAALQKLRGLLCGGGLFMEPGTGKTRTALSFVEERCPKGGEIIVVAPPTVLAVWRAEIEKWWDWQERPYFFYTDPPKIYPPLEKGVWNFWLLSYGVLPSLKWRKTLAKRAFDVGICDESHYIKSCSAQRSRAAIWLRDRCKLRLVLTGTPVLRTLLDTYNQLRFVSPDIFPRTHAEFLQEYAIFGGFQKSQPIAIKHRKQLTETVQANSFIVKKEECLTLPDIMYQEIPVTLGVKAQAIYDTFYDSLKGCLKRYHMGLQHGISSPLTELSGTLMALQRLSGGFASAPQVELIDKSKLKVCVELARNIVDAKRRVVIFARFLAEIEALERELHLAGFLGRTITGAVSLKEREQRVQDFQDGKCDVLIMQSSLGVGISLTAASYIIFYSLTYSYGDFYQAVSRLHRQGQEEKVTVYVLQAGIDKKIYENICRKGSESDLLMSLGGE